MALKRKGCFKTIFTEDTLANNSMSNGEDIQVEVSNYWMSESTPKPSALALFLELSFTG